MNACVHVKGLGTARFSLGLLSCWSTDDCPTSQDVITVFRWNDDVLFRLTHSQCFEQLVLNLSCQNLKSVTGSLSK